MSCALQGEGSWDLFSVDKKLVAVSAQKSETSTQHDNVRLGFQFVFSYSKPFILMFFLLVLIR